MRRVPAAIALAASLALGVSACAADEPELPDDPIAQMEIAFISSPRQDDIREAMDRALNAIDLPTTNDNYSRAGSVLVTMRKEYGLDEMDLLACIPTTAAAGDTFPDVAAKCVARLG